MIILLIIVFLLSITAGIVFPFIAVYKENDEWLVGSMICCILMLFAIIYYNFQC